MILYLRFYDVLKISLSPFSNGFEASATAIMAGWPEAFSRVVPEGDACVITLGFVVPLGDAPMTWWPEAFSRVVPEVTACVLTLGLESAKCYCAYVGFGSFPK